MPRLSKNEKRDRLVLAIAIGVAVGLLLILGIRAAITYSSEWTQAMLSWLMHLFSGSLVMPSAITSPVASSSAALASPAESPSTPQFASPLPLTPTSTFSSATYTELFSGVGFDDATDTTTYEDYVATTISLVPDFSVSPTNAKFVPAISSASASSASSANLTGTMTQNGSIYTASIPAFPDLVVTSTYPGILRFGYDPATGRTLIVYAAYESRVLEMGPTGGGQIGLIADYSSRFGSRAFAGDSYGSRGVNPVIFPQDGAWWIFSGAGSTKPKLMKAQNSAVIDYTQTAFPNEATLAAAPGPAPHEIYVAGSSGSYILTDNGFKQTAVQWVSSKLNQWNGNVAQGEITSVEDSGGVSYFLSNDGGSTWIAVTSGEPLAFPTSGGDFRFKAEISPVADSYASPWVDIVRLEYWVARSTL
jgi:hypothetical protein